MFKIWVSVALAWLIVLGVAIMAPLWEIADMLRLGCPQALWCS